jgi:hypothetical protein
MNYVVKTRINGMTLAVMNGMKLLIVFYTLEPPIKIIIIPITIIIVVIITIFNNKSD